MEKISLNTNKMKKVVECLGKEKDFINSNDFFEKYKTILESVDIKKGNSCSSCLSSSKLKPIMLKQKPYNNIDLQHYKLIDNYKDYLIESN